MKRTCCRDTPRCADCPVRLLAAARRDREGSEAAALVSEVLGGAAFVRTLPPSVEAALLQLEAARSGAAVRG